MIFQHYATWPRASPILALRLPLEQRRGKPTGDAYRSVRSRSKFFKFNARPLIGISVCRNGACSIACAGVAPRWRRN